MLLREKFNDFQLSVFKTRQCTSGTVFLPEGRAIGKRLNLTGNQVRNWFHNHRKELFEMPQVAPEIQKSIDNLLSEVKQEMEENCGKSTGSERISESSLASKSSDAESLPNSKDSLDKMGELPEKATKFTEFQLAFLKTRHCISGNVSLKEARTIGQQLNLNAKRVRSWFLNNKKKRFEIPQVEPEEQKTIDNLLSEVRKQLGESRSHVARLDPPPFLTKEYRLKILETRYRQSHKISSLECHLIGLHFNFDGDSIARWFKRRSHSKKEDDPNFVMCPKILELLKNINRQVDEQSHFEMSDSQRKCLKERFSIRTNPLKNKRIAISEAIGVPDYFIKAWFKKRTKAERERRDRAALVLRLSGSGKDVESVSQSSSASVPSDTEAQSNSEDWFEKMATVQETSKMFLPVNPFSIPTNNEFTTSSNSTIYVPSTVPETQLSPSSTDISNIDESWAFYNDSINSGADFWSSLPYTRSPTHEVKEPWASRNELVKMSLRVFDKFTLAVCITRQCTSESISRKESKALARRLNLTGGQVRSWFYRNKNKKIEMPQVDPRFQKSINDLLSDVKKEVEESHSHIVKPNSPLPLSRKEYQKNVLEARFRRSSKIIGLECHLIGQHLEMEGQSVTNWFSRRKKSGKEAEPNFVICPKVLEFLDNINREVKKQIEFRMSSSQEKYLERRFLMNNFLGKEERISMSDTIGVPDYWIKTWFLNKRIQTGKQERKSLALNATGSGKDRGSEKISEPSSASESSEMQSTSNSEDWFDKMVPATSEMYLPVDPFLTPTSSQFTTSPVHASFSVLGNQSLPCSSSNAPDNYEPWEFQGESLVPVEVCSYLSSAPNYPIDNNYPAAEQHNPGQYIDISSYNPCLFDPLNTNQSVQTQAAPTINHQTHHSSSINNNQTSLELFSSLQVPNQCSSIAFDAMDSTQPQPTDYWSQSTPDSTLQPHTIHHQF
ncbi:unnamed protein product [Caenorhabditis brenneri]